MKKVPILEQVKSLCKIISSSADEARIVGGYIRDFLSGEIPKEIDMATNIYNLVVFDHSL